MKLSHVFKWQTQRPMRCDKMNKTNHTHTHIHTNIQFDVIFSELLAGFVDICHFGFWFFFFCVWTIFFIIIWSRNWNYWCWTINMDTKKSKCTAIGWEAVQCSIDIYSNWQLGSILLWIRWVFKKERHQTRQNDNEKRKIKWNKRSMC